MVFTSSFAAVALTFLLAWPASADNPSGLYTKKSPVVQVTAKTYDRLIAKSNQSAILEFYAPWCGHCQNLKPAYEKAAKSVENLSAKVAAINCDDEDNKAFCGQMGVKGFPTLKTIKPGKKPGKPVVSDYSGERTAKAIADTLIDIIPNHVVKVTDDTLEKFLKDWNHMPKAILFADKGSTSPLLKSLAIDFKDSIKIAQIHKKQEGCIEAFGIKEFPRLLLLPGPEAKGDLFLGEMKSKDELVAFLSTAAPPTPEVVISTTIPDEPKKSSKKDKKKDNKKKPKKDSLSEDEKIIQDEKAKLKGSFDTIMPSPDGFQSVSGTDFPIPAPTRTPDHSKTPVMHIPNIRTPEELNEKCLEENSGTCILAFVPEKRTLLATQVLRSLAEINDHFLKTNAKAFPFYAIPLEGMGMDSLKDSVGDDGEVEVIAVNRKRGWWRHFNGDPAMRKEAIEEWIDEIRFGGKEEEKMKLPDDPSFVGTERVEKYDPTAFRAPIDDEEEEDWDAEIAAAEAAASAAAEVDEEPVTPEADPVEEPIAHEADPVIQESSAEPEVVPEKTPEPEPDHDEL